MEYKISPTNKIEGFYWKYAIPETKSPMLGGYSYTYTPLIMSGTQLEGTDDKFNARVFGDVQFFEGRHTWSLTANFKTGGVAFGIGLPNGPIMEGQFAYSPVKMQHLLAFCSLNNVTGEPPVVTNGMDLLNPLVRSTYPENAVFDCELNFNEMSFTISCNGKAIARTNDLSKDEIKSYKPYIVVSGKGTIVNLASASYEGTMQDYKPQEIVATKIDLGKGGPPTLGKLLCKTMCCSIF
jgi:hypothetical protein